jgi:hypothetical protein
MAKHGVTYAGGSMEVVMVDGKEVRFQALGNCPCGQPIAADLEGGGVGHMVPYCEPFLRLEPTEFLRYVRQALEARQRSRGLGDN